MSPACRPGTAAAAAGVVAVAVGLALRGLAQTPAPPAVEGGDAPLIGPRVRAWYRGVLAPLEQRLVLGRVHPDALTGAQLVVSVLAGAAFWCGWIFLAGWLTILAGTLDILDGGVARGGGRASASLMVSYTRARAEGLGLALQLGRVQRPERYVVIGVGGWLSGLVAHLACPLLGRPTHAVLAAAVVVLAGLSAWTALRRTQGAARALAGPSPS